MKSFFQVAAELEETGEAFVVVTLVSGRGHVPQDPGAKMIVKLEGLHFGTVGGGKVEAKALRHAEEILRGQRSEPELQVWNLTRDIGMTCGGEVTYLFEPKGTRAWSIVVYGAGHVGQEVTRLLSRLDCRVTCVDARAEWLEKLAPSPRLKIVREDEPARLVAEFSPGTYHVVVTKGHGTDLPILHAISRHHPEALYVGSIGSQVKATKIRNDLKSLGVDANFIEKLRCPIGLDFGSNHPAEIAVSIVAQLLQERGKNER